MAGRWTTESYTSVTVARCPALYAALDMLSFARGFGRGYYSYALPWDCDHRIHNLEAMLSSLPPMETAVILLGDRAVAQEIAEHFNIAEVLALVAEFEGE